MNDRAGDRDRRSSYAEALARTEVLATLAAFDPHVVGTPPLGLDLPTSDIDVVCFAPDRDAFARTIWKAFADQPAFQMWQRSARDRSIVANFTVAGWIIEIFGQAVPVSEQHGWRHFDIERRLLALGGEAFHATVMTRRRQSMKTEPAFAAVLGLHGDAYVKLLRLERRSDLELVALLRSRGFGDDRVPTPDSLM